MTTVAGSGESTFVSSPELSSAAKMGQPEIQSQTILRM